MKFEAAEFMQFIYFLLFNNLKIEPFFKSECHVNWRDSWGQYIDMSIKNCADYDAVGS
jgi:hypothetical protein